MRQVELITVDVLFMLPELSACHCQNENHAAICMIARLTFQKVFAGHQEKMKMNRESNRENLRLCCCWHLLKGFAMRQGAGLPGSV